MSIRVLVICDHCGAEGGSHQKHAQQVRKALRVSGWETSRTGGLDFCGRTCAILEAAERAKRGEL